ncbi:acid protease [Lentinus tigrinus ALCF2SS1-7]|uniref:Acid protease n=1 Tax=Lentinus tigrinus ALCF2SS1-6 TaxID=1328759 RepID=A0A5C2SBH0_9APHY|nr:acid protease [Lentinus tigrinus ALCF2SS1-6]RPD75875.1 acid protease [Lentinus tigrinus ALCF2SS1-7]
MHVPSLLATPLLGLTLFSSAFPLGPLAASFAQANSILTPLSGSDAPSQTTLDVARRFKSDGPSNVLKFDQARARALQHRRQLDASSSPTSVGDAGSYNIGAQSQAVTYVVTVQVGKPPRSFQLLVDTGSSNTWVGASVSNPYTPSLSSRPTGELAAVLYGSGFYVGVEFNETVTLAEGLSLSDQSISASIFSNGFNNGPNGVGDLLSGESESQGRIDGILGVGPQDLTCGSFFPDRTKCVPTVTDTAYASGLLSNYMISFSFRPSATLDTIDNKHGELTFGGVDVTKYKGKLDFVPLTKTHPAGYYVGVDQDIVYGDARDNVLNQTAGILDTGTTLILIATDAFKRYQDLTGGVPDDNVGLLRITKEQYGNLKSLYFHIGNIDYELTANAQIWPRALNAAIGGTPEGIYLIVNDLGSNSGHGLDFINGMTFLQRFYMVYDIGNDSVGLAYTDATYSGIN